MRKIVKDLSKKKIYIIGISGIGMSSIAKTLYKRGYFVLGSCDKINDQVIEMRKMGIEVIVGHGIENILNNNIDIVLYSTAIHEDHIELLTAKKQNKILFNRGDFFPYFLKNKKNIAISGTHGKTSTTALVCNVFLEAGEEANMLIGANWDRIKSNELTNDSDYYIIEADESDESFLGIDPYISVINNIDRDHMDHYKNMQNLLESYKKFINSTSQKGRILLNGDDTVLWDYKCETDNTQITTYGFDKRNQVVAYDIKYREGCQFFKVCYYEKELGEFQLNILGRHMISNSLVAIIVGMFFNFDLKDIKKGIRTYELPSRRMEKKGFFKGMQVIDDYAHHPTEMRETYRGMKDYYNKIIVIFQPHRYTRTSDLYNEIIDFLKEVDMSFILPIYGMGEQEIEGVNSVDMAQRSGSQLIDFDNAREKLNVLDDSYDAILMMGAGDIKNLSKILIEK